MGGSVAHDATPWLARAVTGREKKAIIIDPNNINDGKAEKSY